MESDLARAADLLRNAECVAVLTGAGISAESGIPTFRGADGLWNGLSPQQLASPEGFAADPVLVWRWYNLRRKALLTAEPNPGHRALVEIERRVSRFMLATQNVDRLHQAAGSRNLVELHGNIWEVRCTGCGAVFDRSGVELPELPRCERCGGLLRPGVVWFGEQLPAGAFERAAEWAAACDVFLVVGTSAVVYPAAGLAQIAFHAGAAVVEVNLEPTPAGDWATISLMGRAGEILPRLLH